MRRIVLPILCAVFITLFLVACQKESNKEDLQSSENSISVADAKKFFEAEVLPITARIKNAVHKQVDWNKAYSQIAGKQLVVIPVDFDKPFYASRDNGKTKFDMRRNTFLVFYRDSLQKIHAEVVYKQPENITTAKKTFSGSILIESWSGELLKSFKYVDGKRYKGDAVRLASGDYMAADYGSLTYCWITNYYYCVYYNGQQLSCTNSYAIQTCIDLTGSAENPGGGPPDGPDTEDNADPEYEGVGENNWVEFRDITNGVNTPCFSEVVDSISKGHLQAAISLILLQTFNQTDLINISFIDSHYGSTQTDATTNVSSSNGMANYLVDLNIDALQNASKEYIAATIFHEILHAYFATKNIDPVLEHDEMALYYRDQIATAVRSLYPSISENDANALAYGGLQHTYTWSELVRTNPSAANSIVSINQAYKNGTSGVSCN
ncbi:hypothetical protein [Chitinophaga tropicalis]|uniref:Uncharacterized protein n=1 Tax=Chitinophaga tropicalis TaxID=2683588 RepID=A0A7K1UAZ9_9BACT|nr:hypothetical protein [Chitinophaga tropicalis]MVT11557.1 hypothetical protein [Chitinophaga tropicalis]